MSLSLCGVSGTQSADNSYRSAWVRPLFFPHANNKLPHFVDIWKVLIVRVQQIRIKSFDTDEKIKRHPQANPKLWWLYPFRRLVDDGAVPRETRRLFGAWNRGKLRGGPSLAESNRRSNLYKDEPYKWEQKEGEEGNEAWSNPVRGF